jgi:hypothetical protein
MSGRVPTGVDKLFFTGGTETGRAVMRQAADSTTPVVLELGGHDPAIVCEDADGEIASSGILWGAFSNCGQNCNAIERVYVHRRVYERFARGGGIPCVIAGFEPLDILLGIEGILEQLARGEARVENQYARTVRRAGNTQAMRLIESVFQVVPRADIPVPRETGLRAGVDAEALHADRLDGGRGGRDKEQE